MSSTMLAASVVVMVSLPQPWTVPQVLSLRLQDLGELRLPEPWWNLVLAWTCRREKEGIPGPWLFCTRAGDRLSASDLKNRLLRAGRYIGRRISATAFKRSHYPIVVMWAYGAPPITLAEYRSRHPRRQQRFPVPA